MATTQIGSMFNANTYCSPLVEMLKVGIEPSALVLGVHISVEDELKLRVHISVEDALKFIHTFIFLIVT